MSRRTISIATAAALVLVGVMIASLRRADRDREWAHGGDPLNATVDLRVADHETFNATLAALGASGEHVMGVPPNTQALVVRVSWTGAPNTKGRYELMAHDKRVFPPRQLAANGGWTAEGMTGSGWSSSYTKLAEHYEWLADTAQTEESRGSVVGSAVSAPAASTGEVVSTWFVDRTRGHSPIDNPTMDVILTLFYVDEKGEVRWARRIAG